MGNCDPDTGGSFDRHQNRREHCSRQVILQIRPTGESDVLSCPDLDRRIDWNSTGGAVPISAPFFFYPLQRRVNLDVL
jgi:hypothetical protein